MVRGKVVVQPSFWRGLGKLAATVSTVAVSFQLGNALGEFLAAGTAGLVARRLERRAAVLASSPEKGKGRATA